MKRHYSCGSEEHTIHRRALLESAAAASALGLGGFLTGTRAVAEQVKSSRRQVLNVFLHREFCEDTLGAPPNREGFGIRRDLEVPVPFPGDIAEGLGGALGRATGAAGTPSPHPKLSTGLRPPEGLR